MALPVRGVEAVLFDMDGTLIDSEGYTERVVAELLRERGLPDLELDYRRFHGITWAQTGDLLVELYPALAGERLASTLQERFHRLLVQAPPPLIPGAREAVTAASGALPAALVSSSNRQSVEHAMSGLGLLDRFRLTVCAEDCTRSKPDPQCYLLAAERLGVAADRCLVFEDSQAGLQAARSANMMTAAVSAADATADLHINDYTELPPGFFATIKGVG
jgi:HAD superfamily hydrolase (TIGR01509 family)